MDLRTLFGPLGLPTKLALAVALAACIFGSLACATVGFVDVEENVDRHPTTDTGVRATVLYPGQQPPPMITTPPWERAAPGRSQGGATSSAAPGSFSSLGGTRQDVNTKTRVKSEPTFFKYLRWPLAVVAYPFVRLGRLIKGDPNAPDPAAEAAAAAAAPPAALSGEALHAAEETARLRALEEQLAQRQSGRPPAYGAAPPRVAATPPPWEAPAPPAPGAGLSIAEELAGLRAGGAPPGSALQAPTSAPGVPPPRVSAGPGPADRVRDRDGDGRPDHWIYRERERVVQEVYDEDGDGRPDRSVSYDEQDQIRFVEEDADRDGVVDSWIEYQAGVVVRRRADTDADGAPDAWTFYREGRIARHEQDTNGDGFRDRVELFEDGTRVRQEHDRDGDGHPDLTTWFGPDGEATRSEEDRDGDGDVDVRSHYENGRLVRRELLTDAGLGELVEPPPGDQEARATSPGTFTE